MLEVIISDVSITNVGFAIFLKPREHESRKVVPIFIGPLETYSISSALDEITPPRPNTHDLIIKMLAEVETKVLHIIINDIIGHIFYATIMLQTKDGIIELDARPSDSIAIAIRSKSPIFITEKVYNEAAVIIGDNESLEPENPPTEDAMESALQESPVSEIERMQLNLQKAVDEEKFEEAAILRDKIRKLQQEN